MKNRFAAFLISGGILAAGFLIYFFYRDDSIIVNRFAHGLIQSSGADMSHAGFYLPLLPGWLIYSLPDGLWMTSLVIIILMIWDFKIHFRSLAWLIIALALGSFMEFSQGLGWMRGTFDASDLAMLLLGGILPVSFIMIKVRLCKTS